MCSVGCLLNQSVTALDDWPASDTRVLTGFAYTLYWQVGTEQTGGQFSLSLIVLVSGLEKGVCFPIRVRVRVRDSVTVCAWF